MDFNLNKLNYLLYKIRFTQLNFINPNFFYLKQVGFIFIFYYSKNGQLFLIHIYEFILFSSLFHSPLLSD